MKNTSLQDWLKSKSSKNLTSEKGVKGMRDKRAEKSFNEGASACAAKILASTRGEIVVLQ